MLNKSGTTEDKVFRNPHPGFGESKSGSRIRIRTQIQIQIFDEQKFKIIQLRKKNIFFVGLKIQSFILRPLWEGLSCYRKACSPLNRISKQGISFIFSYFLWIIFSILVNPDPDL